MPLQFCCRLSSGKLQISRTQTLSAQRAHLASRWGTQKGHSKGLRLEFPFESGAIILKYLVFLAEWKVKWYLRANLTIKSAKDLFLFFFLSHKEGPLKVGEILEILDYWFIGASGASLPHRQVIQSLQNEAATKPVLSIILQWGLHQCGPTNMAWPDCGCNITPVETEKGQKGPLGQGGIIV